MRPVLVTEHERGEPPKAPGARNDASAMMASGAAKKKSR